MINLDRTATPKDIINAMINDLVEKDRDENIKNPPKQNKQKNVVGAVSNPFKKLVFFTWWAFADKDAVDKLNEKLAYPLTGGKSKAEYEEEATKDRHIILTNEKPDAVVPEGIYLGMQGTTYLNDVFAARPPEAKFSYDRSKYPVIALGAALPRREHIRSGDMKTTNFEDLRWQWTIKEVSGSAVRSDERAGPSGNASDANPPSDSSTRAESAGASTTTNNTSTKAKKKTSTTTTKRVTKKKTEIIEEFEEIRKELKTIYEEFSVDLKKINLNNTDYNNKKHEHHSMIWTGTKKQIHEFEKLAKQFSKTNHTLKFTLDYFEKYKNSKLYKSITTAQKKDLELIWVELGRVCFYKFLLDSKHAGKNEQMTTSPAEKYLELMINSWQDYCHIRNLKIELSFENYFEQIIYEINVLSDLMNPSTPKKS